MEEDFQAQEQIFAFELNAVRKKHIAELEALLLKATTQEGRDAVLQCIKALEVGTTTKPGECYNSPLYFIRRILHRSGLCTAENIKPSHGMRRFLNARNLVY